MPLTNKYLKYSPEITLEIFTLIWESFRRAGYDLEAGLNTIFNNWKRWNHIILNENSLYTTNNPSLIDKLSQTTVQEILGYDPFVKEEVVPEYVECIEVATQNTKIGEIFKCRHRNGLFEFEYNDKSGITYNSWDGWSLPWSNEIPQKFFKPSTKEAFYAQNKPLKQAVHCKTQEEWDFVTEKLNYKWIGSDWYGEDCYINTLERETANKSWWLSRGYQLLSFQEWCDLNGYKMEKEVKFEVGKWYYFESYSNKIPNIARCDSLDNDSFNTNNWIMLNNQATASYGTWIINSMYNIKELYIEEIQQYLPDDHPDKIKVDREFKVGEYIFVMLKGDYYGDILKITSVESDEYASGTKGAVWITHHNRSFSGGGFRLGSKYRYNESVRHATPEEIINHLISIQIPAGEPLNTGIEPNKDGAFKYTTLPGSSWSGCTIQNHLDVIISTAGNCYDKDFETSYSPIKPKMILSIDDEELPMVNIIKTNTIKQLLNNN